MQRREEQEQIMIFRWAAMQEKKYPELRYMYHVPNGGQRSKATAARLKLAGVKRGVPDICLPVPRGGYAGLYIELKAGRNKPTEDQKQWLDALDWLGYKTAVCYGYEESVNVIKNYLNRSVKMNEE